MKKIVMALGLMILLGGTMAFARSEDASESGFVGKDIFHNMSKNDKAAIVVTHFGTTFDDTRALTIDKLNQRIKDKFKNVTVKEAYTSRIIIRRLKARGITKLNPQEVFKQLKDEGYTHVVVQGTNIINGVENENLAKEIAEYQKDFKDIRLGNPLLTTPEDYKDVAKAIVDKVGKLKKGEGVVLVGHGTHHPGGLAYAAMDYIFTAEGNSNFIVGTVEGYPEFSDVVKKLKRKGVKNVILMPFMFVAGDHARNDIAEDWKNNLEKEGFKVSKVILEGLGQNPKIQDIYVKHIEFAMEHKPEDMSAKKVKYSNEKD